MRPFIIAGLAGLILCGCSERNVGTPEMPPKTYSAKPVKPPPIELGKGFDLWQLAKSGSPEQQEKMLFVSSSDSPYSGTQCMQFVNGNDKSPNVYMTAAYVVNGLKPNVRHQLTFYVRNDEGAPYHVFACTDPVWDDRTPCDQRIWEESNGPHKWQMWSKMFTADKSGRVIVRLVMETRGKVSVDGCALEEFP